MSKLEKSKNKQIVAKATPVKEIPEGRKIAKIPEYDAVFKQIIESPEKMFKVEVEGKTVKSMYAPFSFRVKIVQQETRQKIQCGTQSTQQRNLYCQIGQKRIKHSTSILSRK